MKRDFISLNARQALQIAVLIEQRNTELYCRLGEIFAEFCPETPAVAESFQALARVEKNHQMVLANRYMDRYGAVNEDISEEEIRDFIEVPKFAVADVLSAVKDGQAGVANKIALEIAAVAERNALNYYSRLVQTTEDPDLKALYAELAEFEREHSHHVETELAAERRSDIAIVSIK